MQADATSVGNLRNPVPRAGNAIDLRPFVFAL